MLEVRVHVAAGVGERDPQLGAVQQPGVRAGALLGVADRAARGHEAQFPWAYGLEAAQAVAVQDLAVVEPADRLESHVRMGRHLHAGLVGDVVGAVVVDRCPLLDTNSYGSTSTREGLVFSSGGSAGAHTGTIVTTSFGQISTRRMMVERVRRFDATLIVSHSPSRPITFSW